MTDPEIAAVLRRLDAQDTIQQAMIDKLDEHAALDFRQHQAVSLQIAESSATGKTDREAMMARQAEMIDLLKFWNGVRSLRSVIVSVGALVIAIMAIGGAIRIAYEWIRS